MLKSFKYRLYPNVEQRIFFAKTFGCVRFIYNRMLSDKIAYYEASKKTLNTTPAQYKGEFEWLKEVDSLALANAQLNLQTAYKNFFRDPKIGFPKYKSKKSNRHSYTTNNQKGTVSIADGKLRLPKIGWVIVKQHRKLPKDSIIKSATISVTPTGKYYAAILCEYEHDVAPVEPKKVLGLDFSMRELFVGSDGVSAEYPRFYREAQVKLAREQRKLAHCQKGSNNRIKQRKRVARIYEKVANQRLDFLHKLSHQITNAWDAVAIEDLNMQGMSQALHFGKSVADNGWGMFTRMLEYKLAESGKQLVKIDKWFPSSKTCSQCGLVKEILALKDRIFLCECGSVMDRDLNAAINIRNQGMTLLA